MKKSVRLAIYSNKFQYGLVAAAGGGDGGSGVSVFFSLIMLFSKNQLREWAEERVRWYQTILSIGTISARIIVDNSTTHSKQMVNDDNTVWVCLCVR